MRLWLVGLMGSGKTSAGRLAATGLGVGFFDSDEVVAERMGCSVAQIWGELGESAFRDIEAAVTANLSREAGIIATGGGVVLEPRNRTTISETGTVVWLKASPPVLAGRLAGQTDRPLLSGANHLEALAKQLRERVELYRAVADHEIDTETIDLSEVAARIEDQWTG